MLGGIEAIGVGVCMQGAALMGVGVKGVNHGMWEKQTSTSRESIDYFKGKRIEYPANFNKRILYPVKSNKEYYVLYIYCDY